MWVVPSDRAACTLVLVGLELLVLVTSMTPSSPEAGKGLDLLNCSSLAEVTNLEWVGSGWTKAVYRGKLRGRDIAMKTVNLDGHDIESCMSRSEAPSLSWCYRRTTAKLLRELILLQQLEHPNVVKVLGSCIPDSIGPVVVATELGEPLHSIALLQLSWEEKLKVILSVASILHMLAHSPLGSLAAPDLKRQQFVLVEGQLKLADADDLGTSEPSCTSHSDCSLQLNYEEEENVYCISGVCRGYNERYNILRAGKDLVQHILLDSGPESLQPQVANLLEAYSGNSRWNTARILEETEALVHRSR